MKSTMNGGKRKMNGTSSPETEKKKEKLLSTNGQSGRLRLLEGAEMHGVFQGTKKLSRKKVLERQWDYALRTVKRLQKFDEYGHFLDFARTRGADPDKVKEVEINKWCDLNTIYARIQNREYASSEPDSRFSWESLQQDVSLIVKNAILMYPEAEEVRGDVNFEAKRMQVFADEIIANSKKRLERELEQCNIEERLDKMDRENSEPAVQGWRKSPYPHIPYNTLSGYQPAYDLSASEQELVMEKLRSNKEGIGRSEELSLGRDIRQQDVWGIDCFAKKNILESAATADSRFSVKQNFIDFVKMKLLPAINSQPPERGHNIVFALTDLLKHDHLEKACDGILRDVELLGHHNFSIHPKGRGVVANVNIPKGKFVTDYLGELWPGWRWYEKCEAIELLQRSLKVKESLPSFYNILMERDFDDPNGYDLLFVDASRHANFASRLSHSCSPNCATKIVVTNGEYRIEMKTIADVNVGEELTHDYHAGTDSISEYREAVCLCGTEKCRGSYLYHTNDEEYLQVLREHYGIMERIAAVVLFSVNTEFKLASEARLKKYGFMSLLTADLPDWGKRFAAEALRVIEEENEHLVNHLLAKGCSTEDEKKEARDEADGVKHSRIQSLAITLDKIKYALRHSKLGKNAPPPVRVLEDMETIEFLWTGEKSIGKQVYKVIKQIAGKRNKALQKKLGYLNKLLKIELCPPTLDEVRKSLWSFRMILISIETKSAILKSALTTASDLIALYCHTQMFFKFESYSSFDSPRLELNLCDMAGITADHINSLEDEFQLGNVKFNVSSKTGTESKVVYATRTYTAVDVTGFLLNWIQPLTPKVSKEDISSVYGCAFLPAVVPAIEYSTLPEGARRDSKRSAFVSQLQRNSSQPWSLEVKKYIPQSDTEFESIVLGSPMLDQILSNDSTTMKQLVRCIANPIKHSESCLPSVHWVQCDRRKCLKWRKLPGFVDLDSLPDKFYCELNVWDHKRASCNVEAEVYPEEYEIQGGSVPDSEIVVGKRLDVYNPSDTIWYKGKVIAVDSDRIKIHFLGWKSSYDTWIERNTRFIAEAGTHCEV